MYPTEVSTSTQPAARPLPTPGRGQSVDTVRVSPDNFRQLMFMTSAARKEYTQDRRPQAEKPQKRTQQGVPVWSVSLAGVNFRGNSEMLSVTVAMFDDPATLFSAGQAVDLVGLTFGVTSKRDGTGYVTWCSADSIAPAGADAREKAAAAGA